MTHPLVGAWALIATEWRRADGKHANPFGVDAVGVVIYSEAGYMSAQVMREGRAAPPAGAHTGIDTAMATAAAGYIAYFGTYDIDERAGTVTHRVVGSAFPGWVGVEVTRRFTIDGDRMTLRDSVVSADGVAVEAATIWERAG